MNITGLFDDFGSKMKMMIIIQSINQFVQFCIDDKIEPTVTKMTEWIKEKTGLTVNNDFLEVMLKIALSNVNLFIMFTINEAAEKLAEDMLDSPSNIIQVLKKVV